MIQRKMIHLHIQFFNPPSTLLNLRNPPKFYSLQLWGDFPAAAKQMIINYNEKIKVPNPRPHFNGSNTKPKSTLGQSNPSPNKFIFMKMTILLIILPQKLLLKPWLTEKYLPWYLVVVVFITLAVLKSN